jgi:hypothetical protein
MTTTTTRQEQLAVKPAAATPHRRGKGIKRRGVIAAILAIGALLVTALPANALATTYGSQGNCQFALHSGTVDLQPFIAHKLRVHYEMCTRYSSSQRPSAQTVAYARLTITAPSSNPGSPVETVTINSGDWFSIGGGLARRYWYTVHHDVLRVPGSGSDFEAHVDVAANTSSYHINSCFGSTCKTG